MPHATAHPRYQLQIYLFGEIPPKPVSPVLKVSFQGKKNSQDLIATNYPEWILLCSSREERDNSVRIVEHVGAQHGPQTQAG
jgi:hypothetical protein